MTMQQREIRAEDDILGGGFRGVDPYWIMLLIFSSWEGRDRGVPIAGLVIGIAYVILYYFEGKILETAMTFLLARCSAKKKIRRFFVYALWFLLQLVCCYYLFLYLAWQTIGFYVTLAAGVAG
ncbi:MAG: hypothetical protein IJR99_03465 [Kiritimatiellae bacterium]|nr:hypothetical protein [Kiritimatiellia bacterium]